MHEVEPLSCTDCHGGDSSRPEKERAHVLPRTTVPNDERVFPAAFDLPFLRFRNPMDLRVTAETCGRCHPDIVDHLPLSLHGTTSGHLGDGLYENGVVPTRGPRVSIFPVRDATFDPATAPPGAVAGLARIPGFKATGDRKRISTHFSDVPRKSCMQCHLWSRGRAVRGRLGMDGDYRGDGCAACHVPYADDGISRSADATISRVEPGHPARHAMVRVPSTNECIRCHYGDASIGLSFRGLAQPVPGMPQSPDAPGFSRKRLNGVFYVEDPAVNPPDVHHQRGMQCADCHTGRDAMGDGRIYVRMEDAVEMECASCHGTPAAVSTGLTERGNRVRGLESRADGVWLRSPSDGRLRRIKQARDVVDPTHPDFNRRAAQAMTADHGRLECYACHTGWNPNFFGFHFDRNEGFTQLDVLDGDRTQGRVTTQEKVFATFKQFYLGWDSHGSVAPYMVGFSTMATVHAADGTLLLDQEMPVTAAGLSGMTMIHHQPHATTARARTCVECHRAPATWGLGSVNFRLAREFLFTAGEQGLQIIGFDRKTPANTRLVAQVGLADIRAMDVRCDDLQGRAEWIVAACGDGSLVLVDVRSPMFPKVLTRIQGAVSDPRAVLCVDDAVFVADGTAGVRVFEGLGSTRLRQVAALPLESGDAPGAATGLFLDGPWLHVAGGTAGLVVVDVSDRARPSVLSRTRIGDPELPDDARAVSVLFQYSRPGASPPEGPRTRPRALAAVAGGLAGLHLVDVTRPEAPRSLGRVSGTNAAEDVALVTVFEIGSEGGGIASRETDLALVTAGGGVVVVDVSDPSGPAKLRGAVALGPPAPRRLRVIRAYNPPFLLTFALVTGPEGARLVDLAHLAEPRVAASLALGAVGPLGAEEFPLDRMINSVARPLKDVSHEGARYLNGDEVRRILGVPMRAE